MNKIIFSQQIRPTCTTGLLQRQRRPFEKIKAHFELKYRLLEHTYVLVQLDGVRLKTFCERHAFHKPVDQRHLNLMNDCARQLFHTHMNDLLCAYGFSDEYNLVFKRDTQLYDRNYK